MTATSRTGRRKIPPKTWRMLLYLSVLLGLAGWRFLPRPWHPTVTIQTTRYAIESTATQKQTDSTAEALQFLYTAYSNRFSTVEGFRRDHSPLRVRLFKDRDEFRWVNPGLGWAEAYYRPPICRAYFPKHEKNPHHWMLHEAVHQLNHEVAGFERTMSLRRNSCWPLHRTRSTLAQRTGPIRRALGQIKIHRRLVRCADVSSGHLIAASPMIP